MRRMRVDALVGTWVVEVGIRQAWPFLVVADASSGAEVRLYLDAPWTLGASSHDATEDTAWLVAAAGPNGQNVVEAQHESDGSLIVTTGEGVSLTVSGRAASYTTGEPWWLGR